MDNGWMVRTTDVRWIMNGLIVRAMDFRWMMDGWLEQWLDGWISICLFLEEKRLDSK